MKNKHEISNGSQHFPSVSYLIPTPDFACLLESTHTPALNPYIKSSKLYISHKRYRSRSTPQTHGDLGPISGLYLLCDVHDLLPLPSFPVSICIRMIAFVRSSCAALFSRSSTFCPGFVTISSSFRRLRLSEEAFFRLLGEELSPLEYLSTEDLSPDTNPDEELLATAPGANAPLAAAASAAALLARASAEFRFVPSFGVLGLTNLRGAALEGAGGPDGGGGIFSFFFSLLYFFISVELELK